MEANSHNESDYILDNYQHTDPRVFYSVTRTAGKGISDSEFEELDSGCSCPDSQCTVRNNCSCLRFGVNYSPTEDGLILVKEKFENVPIFECNFRCSCFASLKRANERENRNLRATPKLCPNRNVQFGPAAELEVFDAGAKGLGLKTRKKIRAGSFICEYAGEVISLEEAKRRQGANGDVNYIFVLKEFSGEKLSGVTCVDPTHVGNIGRYINHSCRPNAAVVPVRVNDTVPWLCVFAVRDLEENEEICYDYSGLSSLAGDIKTGNKLCLCNSSNCKKYLPFEDI